MNRHLVLERRDRSECLPTACDAEASPRLWFVLSPPPVREVAEAGARYGRGTIASEASNAHHSRGRGGSARRPRTNEEGLLRRIELSGNDKVRASQAD